MPKMSIPGPALPALAAGITMRQPPVTARIVPSHQARVGVWRKKSDCSAPAQIGPLPMATAVPTATPVAFTPAKNVRL